MEETGSTNNDLVERARNGAPSGEVLIARHQTAGKGRQGRTWFDQPDASLLMSWSTDIESALAPLVPLVVGTAVAEALDAAVGRRVAALKWPNDVLIPELGERKITGILAEAVQLDPTDSVGVGGTAGPTLRVVVGMGTNLDLRLGDANVPDDVASRAADLASLTNGTINRAAIVEALLDACDECITRLESSVDEALEVYRDRCITIGRAVRFETPAGVLDGTATAVADDGALLLETADGVAHRLVAGDAHHAGGHHADSRHSGPDRAPRQAD